MGIHEKKNFPCLTCGLFQKGQKILKFLFFRICQSMLCLSFFSFWLLINKGSLCPSVVVASMSFAKKIFQKLLHANSQRRDPTCFATKTDWHLKRMRAESFFSFVLFFAGKGLCVGVLKEITREGGEQRLKVHERCLTVHWQMLKVLYKRDYYYFLWLCVLEMFWWCIEFKFQSYNLLQPLFLCQLTGCCQRAPGRMVLNGSQHTHTPRNHFSTPPLSIPIRARPSKCQLPDYSISLSRFVSNTAPPTAETRKNFFM